MTLAATALRTPRRRGGPGGWILLDEPELPLGEHGLVAAQASCVSVEPFQQSGSDDCVKRDTLNASTSFESLPDGGRQTHGLDQRRPDLGPARGPPPSDLQLYSLCMDSLHVRVGASNRIPAPSPGISRSEARDGPSCTSSQPSAFMRFAYVLITPPLRFAGKPRTYDPNSIVVALCVHAKEKALSPRQCDEHEAVVLIPILIEPPTIVLERCGSRTDHHLDGNVRDALVAFALPERVALVRLQTARLGFLAERGFCSQQTNEWLAALVTSIGSPVLSRSLVRPFGYECLHADVIGHGAPLAGPARRSCPLSSTAPQSHGRAPEGPPPIRGAPPPSSPARTPPTRPRP